MLAQYATCAPKPRFAAVELQAAAAMTTVMRWGAGRRRQVGGTTDMSVPRRQRALRPPLHPAGGGATPSNPPDDDDLAPAAPRPPGLLPLRVFQKVRVHGAAAVVHSLHVDAKHLVLHAARYLVCRLQLPQDACTGWWGVTGLQALRRSRQLKPHPAGVRTRWPQTSTHQLHYLRWRSRCRRRPARRPSAAPRTPRRGGLARRP